MKQTQRKNLSFPKIRLVCQFHPSAALHQPRLWSQMRVDWEYMPQKANCDYTIAKGRVPRFKETIALDTENSPDGTIGHWSAAYRDPTGQLMVASYYGATNHAHFGGRTIFHNSKWDIRILRRNKMPEPDNVVDTMIAAYVLGYGFQDVKDSSVNRSGGQMVGGLGLKYLARRHLGMPLRDWKEIKDAPDGEVQEYNAMDSVATLLLWEQFEPQLPEHFWSIDMPLLKVIMAIEDRGIAIDPDFLKKYAESLDERLKTLELPIENVWAVEQIRSYIYGKLGIEPWKFTDTGAPSTDASVLETIDDEGVRAILEYKSIAKEKTTYTGNYVTQVGSDGRLHCEFKQTRTATGRLASASPNLQNVVREGDMRKLFIAPPGFKIVRVDWKQLELLVLAAVTQDPTMLGAIQSGRSIHQETADAFGVSYNEAKTINYLMQYRGSPWKISMEYHIPIDQAKELSAKWYRMYPAVKQYHEKQIETAKSEKRVVNSFGRVRRLDAMYASDWRVRQEGEREAINTPIQGDGAEIVKRAMIDLHYKHSAPMILNVHDELLLEVTSNKANDYAHWLKEYLPTITEINGIRFAVDVGVGQNWKDAKE